MTSLLSDVEAFARLVQSLRPLLGQVVFVGGWAHRLYRLHPQATAPDLPALMTRDADVALPAAKRKAGKRLLERLNDEGFHEELFGTQRPPVTKYVLGAGTREFYVEFLTPLVGSAVKRRGVMDSTASVEGVTAQKLRHVDVLLLAPWSVTLDVRHGFPISEATEVRLPNAASYLAQKMLIHKKRLKDSRAKDLLYIHDTIELFAGSLREIRGDWIRGVKPNLSSGKDVKSIEGFVANVLEEVGDDVRSAALIASAASGRTLRAQSILEVCRAGLGEIFAESKRDA